MECDFLRERITKIMKLPRLFTGEEREGGVGEGYRIEEMGERALPSET